VHVHAPGKFVLMEPCIDDDSCALQSGSGKSRFRNRSSASLRECSKRRIYLLVYCNHNPFLRSLIAAVFEVSEMASCLLKV
jgi:hypothetical protein